MRNQIWFTVPDFMDAFVPESLKVQDQVEDVHHCLLEKLHHLVQEAPLVYRVDIFIVDCNNLI